MSFVWFFMCYVISILNISRIVVFRHPIEDRIVEALGKKWHVEVSTENKKNNYFIIIVSKYM